MDQKRLALPPHEGDVARQSPSRTYTPGSPAQLWLGWEPQGRSTLAGFALHLLGHYKGLPVGVTSKLEGSYGQEDAVGLPLPG